MSLISMLSGIAFAVGFIAMILYVAFGQITVRKLRKNPETKHALGVEFASGWDILNAAEVLSLPKAMIGRMGKSRLSFMNANADLLYKHTNRFDRFLARIFFWSFYFSGFSLIILGILNWFGVFD